MLIVKVCINHVRIDEIHILNTGHKNAKGEHLYRIRKPDGLNHHEIYHDRKRKWFHLVAQILEILENNEVQEGYKEGS